MNESRFDKRVPSLYSRTNESRWKSFIEWHINRDDLKSSGFPETVSDPILEQTSLVSILEQTSLVSILEQTSLIENRLSSDS